MFFIYAIYGSYFLFLLKDNWYKFFNLKSFRNITNNPYFLLCTDVLERNSYYYQQLSKPAKDVFAARTIEFVNDVEWKGFNEFEIKDKHKILIAASAIQLTFGFRFTQFENLKRIFIAPTQFYSRIFERDVKGLTMPIAIYLSWQHFEEGIKTNNDALNLGLHEFAHALDIQFKKILLLWIIIFWIIKDCTKYLAIMYWI